MDFDISLVIFGEIFCSYCFPSVLSLNDLKLHKTSVAKYVFIREKQLLQLTLKPGLR